MCVFSVCLCDCVRACPCVLGCTCILWGNEPHPLPPFTCRRPVVVIWRRTPVCTQGYYNFSRIPVDPLGVTVPRYPNQGSYRCSQRAMTVFENGPSNNQKFIGWVPSHTRTRTLTHTRTHAHTHTRTHTRTCTHVHAHTHTQSCPRQPHGSLFTSPPCPCCGSACASHPAAPPPDPTSTPLLSYVHDHPNYYSRHMNATRGWPNVSEVVPGLGFHTQEGWRGSSWWQRTANHWEYGVCPPQFTRVCNVRVCGGFRAFCPR
jgi:hypothetical protein